MHRPLALAALLLFSTLAALAPPAEAAGSAAINGCARLTHYATSSSSNAVHFRVSTDTSAVSTACTDTGAFYLEPVCTSFNVKHARLGGTAPSDANRWYAYFINESRAADGTYIAGTENDHGTTGKNNWGYYFAGPIEGPDGWYWTTSPNGQTINFCPPQGGMYRLVLRMCQLTINQAQQTCDSAATNYDVNSDVNPTCSCSGADAGALYSAEGNPAALNVQWNPELRDPLTLGVKETRVTVGTSVNFTVDARYLNATLRPGAGSNITIHVLAPDQTWPVDGANPTEMKFSDGTGMGRYYYSFTPSQTGKYEIIARTISSLNERVISKPLELDVVSAANALPTYAQLEALINNMNGYLRAGQNTTTAPLATSAHLEDVNHYLATRVNVTTDPLPTTTELEAILAPLAREATLAYFGSGIYGVVNLTLTADEFRAWNVGEYRPSWLTLNGTAREASLVYYGNGIWGVANLTLTADEFRAWNVGEFRPTRVAVNGTLTADRFEDWDETEFHPAWATINGTDGNVTSANNTASGALTQAYFNQWRDGEFRLSWLTLNGTLDLATFATYRDNESRMAWGTLNGTRAEMSIKLADLETLQVRTLTELRAEGNKTRSYLPGSVIHETWNDAAAWYAGKGPRTSDLALVALFGLCMLLWGIWAPKTKRYWRLQFTVAGLALLGAYAYASGLLPTHYLANLVP